MRIRTTAGRRSTLRRSFGQRAAVERLMAAGADINAVSRNALRNTPLHAAVAGGHVEVSLLLINAAADVNVADAGGHTAFHIAAEAGYVPVARALFERGADAHAVDAEDRTPLSRAAAKGHTDIVDLINVVGVRDQGLGIQGLGARGSVASGAQFGPARGSGLGGYEPKTTA